MSFSSKHLYNRNEKPLGLTWEKWVSIWCSWMLSIPKATNPSIDETGKFSSINQDNKDVWFLTGTFGNIVNVRRKCTVPNGKAIFLPILEKEDSLADDTDLSSESDLVKRASEATNRIISMEASLDGTILEELERYRVRSEVFDLAYPRDNVYGVKPGNTRAVCDGYWLFLKPLNIGKHVLHFKGETSLVEDYTLNLLRQTNIYKKIHGHLDRYLTFKLEVTYDLNIVQ